jgi:uncharacterized protein
MHPMLRIALAIPLVAGAAAVRADEPAPRSITVMGTGKVSAAPDTAEIAGGAVTEAPTAEAAVQANDAIMKRALAALEELGIPGRDIQTQRYEVSPTYAQNRDRGGRGQIVGYRVANRVSVRVHDLEKLGPVLDKLVAAGANEMDGIAFQVGEPTPLLDQARTLAVADAERKAALYARAAGVSLGRVLRIDETGGGIPMPMPRMAAMEAAVPIAPGQVDLSASVTVVYAIE